MAPGSEVTKQQRLLHLGLNCLVFGICYLLANRLAQQLEVNRHVALALDAQIPFWPWMLLPYLSSGLWLTATFLTLRSRDTLRVFSQRLLLATVLAALVFVLYPLRFSLPRPAVDTPWLATLYGMLAWVDRPYNQLPSLHVAYCLLLWASLRDLLAPLWARSLLAAGLLLTAVSTLFTYQHHLLDLLGGVVLGGLCVYAVRPVRNAPNVALYYLVAGGVAAVVGLAAWPAVLTLYGVLSLWLVGLAYARGDRQFLHKREGRYPWWIVLLYAPYLLGYRLSWRAVAWHERHRPAIQQIAPQLWIGRRLSETEARLLPTACSVFDLCCELPETPALRHQRYQHFPLLDIVAPPAEVVHDIVTALRRETAAGHTVYLHCAMGYRRCVQIAKAFNAFNEYTP
ncbi:PAP2 superfamily protein [Rhodoferax sp. OV413]|uniref:phosphatase PAP2 family protein n=1 Tax=Rhodoferax sp. OV413 TaxID=1855285 RepID=UPI000880DF7D|nr:phosphatase PAP2 family protein [Rhodoferax sp. OV413]SDP88600.1 PAP2 superfamily protein [Rhodoferax sp. OV413]